MSERIVPVISTINVTRDYLLGKTVVRALRGVSLEIEQEDFVSIMGPSGSGKSTLMHLIGCLDSPTSGSICIEGEDVSKKGEVELAKINLWIPESLVAFELGPSTGPLRVVRHEFLLFW